MMSSGLFLSLSALLTVAIPPPPSQDTVAITRQVIDSLIDHQRIRPPVGPMAAEELATQRETYFAGTCLADRGEECFGPDQKCEPGVPCRPGWRMESMMEWLRVSAREHPEAGFVVGYTAYTLTRLGREDEAVALARACRATRWWCAFVEAHVSHAQGQLRGAEALFEQGLREAPDSIRCAFTEVGWIVGRDVRRDLDGLGCEDRRLAAERVWWLTDPLFALDGNDRRTEHLNRVLTARLFLVGLFIEGDVDRQMTASHMSQSLRDHFWGRIVPRGMWDSWEKLPRPRPNGILWNLFTGRNAARYHFVPDFEDGDLSRPVWRLEAELDDEGYTPPYGTFQELFPQIARFRTTGGSEDSMRVALAGTLAGTEMTDTPSAEPHLVFSDAPGSFPIHLTSAFEEQRTAFLTHTPVEPVG